MLLTDNQKEDGAIKHMKVWFTDKTISTWQAAFAKLGIPSEGVKEEQKENYVAVTLAPIGGKAWRGYFYAKHSDDEQGRPCLALGIPK